jgi:hypothetical protein
MKKLLEVVRHPLDPERFHQLLTKKQWFLLFTSLPLLRWSFPVVSDSRLRQLF